MLTSPIERANASSSIFCARACVCLRFCLSLRPSLFFLSLVTRPSHTLNQTFPFDSRLFLKIVTSAKERRRRQKQRQTMAAEEETTRKSHDEKDEKDAGADVVVARETRTNDDDAQQINSSASSTGSSFSSKLFLLAFIGLSVALGLREDVGELVKGSGGIENETTRGETMQQKEDAISVGDRIHISFCQS